MYTKLVYELQYCSPINISTSEDISITEHSYFAVPWDWGPLITSVELETLIVLKCFCVLCSAFL